MTFLLNFVIDMLAGAVNVAAIRWPELALPGAVPESELEQKASRVRKLVSTVFFVVLVVVPLALMGWMLG